MTFISRDGLVEMEIICLKCEYIYIQLSRSCEPTNHIKRKGFNRTAETVRSDENINKILLPIKWHVINNLYFQD